MIKMKVAENSAELERCLEIRRRVFIEEKGVSPDIEIDEHDRLGGEYKHFIVSNNEADVGTARCVKTSENSVQVQRFCVLAELRGRGFGKAVMELIEDYYKDKGINKIELHAKYSVHKFYEKCGYKKVSDIFVEADVEHIKMEKEI